MGDEDLRGGWERREVSGRPGQQAKAPQPFWPPQRNANGPAALQARPATSVWRRAKGLALCQRASRASAAVAHTVPAAVTTRESTLP